MRVLVIDQYQALLAMCLRAQDEGHEVRLWMPPKVPGRFNQTGEGMVTKINNWQSSVKWADLIITATNQKYMREIGPLFAKGLPVFGCNPAAAQLELDRGIGQKVCEDYGIDTLPYEVFTSWDDAISHVEKTKESFVCKPWGGLEDKALTYVPNGPEDLILKLTNWKKAGKLKGQIMLQTKVDGIEMAVGGWFGPRGFNSALCENFEEKKFMNDNLGCNTGEQGTTLRYVTESKLFENCLEPLTGILHKLNYVGYVDMNTIILPNGRAMPLEATMRFGYPLRDIQNRLHKGDSITWMKDLVDGRDSLKVSEDIAVGVVLSHGIYPQEHADDLKEYDVPLYGLTAAMEKDVHFLSIKMGEAPVRIGEKFKWIPMPVTSGDQIAIVTGADETVSGAAEKAYNILWKLKPPTNKMFRTDISQRLKKQLPELQSMGYAKGMKY